MAATKMKLDFRGVKDSIAFQPVRIKAGEYKAKITKVDDHVTSENNKGWVFTVVVEGHRNNKYPIYCMFDVKQLWKLKKLLASAGIKVSDSSISNVDPAKLVGRTIGVEVVDAEYQGKLKSEIAGTFPASDLASAIPVDDDDEDAEEEDEIDEDDEDEDEDEVDEDEDDEEEEEPEPAPKKRTTKKAAPAPAKKATKKATAKKRRVVEEDDDDDLEVDDL